MKLQIRPDLEVISYVYTKDGIQNSKVPRTFSTSDLSKYVSFFLEKINNIPADKKIGIVFDEVSIQCISTLLALIKSQRDYAIFYRRLDSEKEWPTQFYSVAPEYCDYLFFLGDFGIYSNFYKHAEYQDFLENSGISGALVSDSYETLLELDAHQKFEELNFEFGVNQKIYFVSEHGMGLGSGTGKIEYYSIKAAIDNYFHPDDVCIINRPFKHPGVGTLNIYPAIFHAKKVILCATLKEWLGEYEQANHVHMGNHMINTKYPLPKKLRMLTSGGYPFNDDCMEYVTANTEIENIIDCYGTRHCPPPLAIRYLEKGEQNLSKPFLWINEYIKLVKFTETFADVSFEQVGFIAEPDTFKDVQGEMTASGILVPLDRIEMAHDAKEFYFRGPKINYVRVNHDKLTEHDFTELLKTQINQQDFRLRFEYKNDMPFPTLIVIGEDNYEKIKAYFNENAVECKLLKDGQ